jgi:hypothetical protein
LGNIPRKNGSERKASFRFEKMAKLYFFLFKNNFTSPE